MYRKSNRRTFLKSAAGASAATLAYTAGSRQGFAQDPTAVPTVPPVSVGEGGTEITMWVQDFGPVIDAFKKAAETYMARRQRCQGHGPADRFRRPSRQDAPLGCCRQ